MNATTTTPDVPPPAGAVEVCDWYRGSRYFVGRHWLIEGDGWHKDDIEVFLHGTQQAAGEVDWVLSAGALHPDVPITSQQARQTARALLEAADELDRLADPEGKIEQ